MISLHAKVMFRAKKLLCKNGAAIMWRREKVLPHKNVAVKKCCSAIVTLCRSVPSYKIDPPCKRVAVQKCPLMQKCPLVLKWRSCKRVHLCKNDPACKSDALQKCPLVLKWRSCKSYASAKMTRSQILYNSYKVHTRKNCWKTKDTISSIIISWLDTNRLCVYFVLLKFK